MKIAFLVAGFGYGNSSRQLAIIKELKKQDPEISITVFTWGRGYDFLQNEAKGAQFELKSLAAQQGRWSGSYKLSFILATIGYVLKYPVNLFLLGKWARKFRPDVVVFDSDYHVPAFLFAKARRISLNQAANIYMKGRKHSWSFILKSGFFFSYTIEMMDFWFQYLFSEEVLVPSLSEAKYSDYPKLRPVPLIVRKEFLDEGGRKFSARSNKPALVLGGSGIDVSNLKAWANKSSIKVFERKNQSESMSRSLAKDLEDFNPIIVQGGLSSLSECLALGKFMFIVPVMNHWEQFINGEEVESLGLGKMTTFENLDRSLGDFLKQEPNNLAKKIDCTGAETVSDIILRKSLK